MIGRLQRNKVKSVVRWADTVHSLDSGRLTDALSGAVAAALDAGERSRAVEVLVQVSLDGDPSRGGVRSRTSRVSRIGWRPHPVSNSPA